MGEYQEQEKNPEQDGNTQMNQQRFCTLCDRLLPEKRTKEVCTACEDKALYYEIREYVRTKGANERELARVFDVPLIQIRRLVRNGRVEYGGSGEPGTQNYCTRCGEPVNFGAYCSECMRIIRLENNRYKNLIIKN